MAESGLSPVMRLTPQGTPAQTPKSARRASTGGGGKGGGGGGGDSGGVSSIKVLCRFRPARAGEPCAATVGGSLINTNTGGFILDEERGGVEYVVDTFDRKSFTFDKLFGMGASQSEVFDSMSDIVDGIIDGFNGAIMAYGQTSAGKTWSMEGPSIWDMDSQGAIPRAVDRIFDGIAKANASLQFQVLVSYYEIYCEKIRDLLNPSQDNLKLRESKTEGFVVQDVTETYCTNRDEVLRLMELGKTYRQTAPTLMNAESSRSHSILSILLDQKDQNTGRQKKGRLFLVDLAGSEKVSKTGASGMRLEEAKNINSSLTVLGMVITALTNESATHIPYRDSKLTRLLQEALGGNSKTSLIVCCAPELRHMSETVGTLRFGERAKRIQNRVRINEELSLEELKSMLLAARKEIALLKAQAGVGTGGDLSPLRALVLDGIAEAPAAEPLTPAAQSQEDSKSAEAAAATAALQAEIERLTLELSDAQSEASALRVRCAALEEELDTESSALAGQRERELQQGAELQALRSTIDELESKLLRAALEAKNLSPSGLGSASKDRGDDGPGASAAVLGTPLDSRQVAVNLDASALQHEAGDAEDKSSSLLPHQPAPSAATAGQSASSSSSEEDSRRSADRTRSSEGATSTYLQQYASNSLSPDLKDLLEEEIKSLEANLVNKDSEARSAQASAVNYAEKYIRLRDDYESHVQRLMMKLTREQQARIQAEDSLEDALQRLWNDEEERKNSGGFFSLFTTSSSNRGSERRGLSARERSLARSLDIAQSRAFQLAAELEANKEAHSIVLDTKESVMRSLVKQNAQLSTERDALKKRAEELVALNENITSLLRSSSSRRGTAVVGRPAASNTISGGGGGGGAAAAK